MAKRALCLEQRSEEKLDNVRGIGSLTGVGRIPQRFIDDVLARVDIVEVIETYLPLKKRGREHIACCPFHAEKTPSFTVSQEKQFYHCFGCQAHGTALGFLIDYEHLDFVDAVAALASHAGLDIPKDAGEIRGERRDGLYQVLEKATRLYKHSLRESPQAIDYLRRRGLTGEVAAAYSLGYAPAHTRHLIQHFDKSSMRDLARAGLVKQIDQDRSEERFRGRVMFPIRDRRGRAIGFGGRVLDDGQPKYLNSPDTPLFSKGESVYGLFELRKRQARPQRVLLVEGYMDVLALVQHGVHNVVAALGTAVTQQQLQQIFRVTHEVVFCFDGDRAGREAAWRAAQQLLAVFRDGWQARFMFLPDGEDPDSLVRRAGKDALIERTKTATPLSAYVYKHLEEDLDIDDAAGRARLMELARPLLKTLPEGMFKAIMYDELARRIHMPVDALTRPAEKRKIQRSSSPRLTANSPVRMAIAILLQRPSLAQHAPSVARLSSFNLPGVSLLVSLIETLRANPHLNSTSLLERYRDSEHHAHLLKLKAGWFAGLEEFDVAAEFNDALLRLSAAAAKQRSDLLLRKERREGLSAEERQELQALLEERRE